MANDRSNIRLLSEILSATAVVISLVFVGLEVRESARQTALNTRSLEVAAYQNLIGRIADMGELAFVRPDLNAVWFENADATTDDGLSREDRERIFQFINARLRYGDLALYQYELGMISEERLESAIRPLTGRLCKKLFSSYLWPRMKENFVPSYRAFIDQRVGECP